MISAAAYVFLVYVFVKLRPLLLALMGDQSINLNRTRLNVDFAYNEQTGGVNVLAIVLPIIGLLILSALFLIWWFCKHSRPIAERRDRDEYLPVSFNHISFGN
jgi:hypothetical protein